MFLDELKKRNVPSLKSRAEMLELLQREEYGCLPKAPESFVWEAEPDVADNFCAGKATLEKLTFRVVVNGKDFAFPVYLAVPQRGRTRFLSTSISEAMCRTATCRWRSSSTTALRCFRSAMRM